MAQGNGEVLLDLGNGEQLSFLGKTLSSFGASQFTFANATSTPASGAGGTTPPATTEPTVPADMAKLSAGTQSGYYVTNAATKTATGTAGNDHIWSNGSGQTLVGNGGDDLFHIGTNTDAKIMQSSGLATVETWAGNYTLASGAHNVVAMGDYAHSITGNGMNNAMVGANGVDTLNGGAGNDMLIGGGGKDALYGGAGKDLFVYRAMSEAGDTVKDFVRGEDLLDLRSLMKALNVTSDPAAAGIVKLADTATGTIVSVDIDGTGAGAAVNLVTIVNTKIGASDYVWH
jgi:Ca2+-binding RTX toxin-like protein